MANKNIDQDLVRKVSAANKEIIKNRGADILVAYSTTPNLPMISKIFNVSEDPLRKYLKECGVYEPYSKRSMNIRFENVSKTVMDRYGENNISGLHRDRLKSRNAIPMTELPFVHTLEEYKWKVNQLTNQSAKKLLVTRFCYYSGIKFVDADSAPSSVNPNDPLKRSIDHKINVLQGFMADIDAEIIGSASNLVYSCRYLNSIKSNSNSNDKIFVRICKIFRRKMIDVGFEYT